jgi:type IX secretion system PorP/SprF family membrane protein
MRKIVLTICLVYIGFTGYAQQYPVFSQYYFNELVINPAYAGANVQASGTLMYRNQWVNFPGSPRTVNMSGHSSFMRNKIGIGVMFNHDEIGSYKNNHVYGSYAYKIHMKKSTLAMGLQAGFNLLGADYSKLDLMAPGDLSFLDFTNSIKPNFGAGLYYTRKNFFLGASVPFILNNKVLSSVEALMGEIREARYYFIRGGGMININDGKKVKLNPSFLIRSQEGQPLSFDANLAFVFYDVFSIGSSYRLEDALVTFIDLKITDKIHFGYSYDITQSSLRRYSSGTHEFVLNFRSIIRGVHKNPECPQYYNYR